MISRAGVNRRADSASRVVSEGNRYSERPGVPARPRRDSAAVVHIAINQRSVGVDHIDGRTPPARVVEERRVTRARARGGARSRWRWNELETMTGMREPRSRSSKTS